MLFRTFTSIEEQENDWSNNRRRLAVCFSSINFLTAVKHKLSVELDHIVVLANSIGDHMPQSCTYRALRLVTIKTKQFYRFYHLQNTYG